jgi:hypothetical protein
LIFNQIDNMTYTYNSKCHLSTLHDNADGTKGFVTPTPGTAQGYTYDPLVQVFHASEHCWFNVSLTRTHYFRVSDA